MPFSSNSMGFGAGQWGLGPYGHGPWVNIPFSCQAIANDGYQYETPIALFEDLGEQRFLLSRERGQNLAVDMAYVDSGRAASVRSFFRAAGGDFTRFVATDYRNNAPYVVRLQSRTLPVGLQAGNIWRMDPMNLRVEMNYPYAHIVRAHSAALYWRMDIATDQATCMNASANSVAPRSDLLTPASPHSLQLLNPGLLSNQDFNPAITFSGTSYFLYLLSLSASALNTQGVFTIEAWVQFTSTAKMAAVGYLSGSSHLFFGVYSGRGYFELTGTSSGTATGGVAINDGAKHHILGLRNQGASYISLYVDGSLVSSVVDATAHPTFGNPLYVGGYGANSWLPSQGYSFVGTVDEVAMYYCVLSESMIRTHYRVGAGVD